MCKFIAKGVCIRYKNGWVRWFVQLYFGREERALGFVQERMDLLNYSIERLIDVAAALVLRAGYRWVDRYFAATRTNGEATDVRVPLGNRSRTGSGGSPSTIGGGGSRRSPSGGQPIDRAGDVIGGGDVVLDLTVAE